MTDAKQLTNYIASLQAAHPDWDAAALAHAADRVFCRSTPPRTAAPAATISVDVPDGQTARDVVDAINRVLKPTAAPSVSGTIRHAADAAAEEGARSAASQRLAQGMGAYLPDRPTPADLVVDRDGDVWARTRTHRRWVCLTVDSAPEHESDLVNISGPLESINADRLADILAARRRAPSLSKPLADALLTAREATERAAAGIARAFETASATRGE